MARLIISYDCDNPKCRSNICLPSTDKSMNKKIMEKYGWIIDEKNQLYFCSQKCQREFLDNKKN